MNEWKAYAVNVFKLAGKRTQKEFVLSKKKTNTFFLLICIQCLKRFKRGPIELCVAKNPCILNVEAIFTWPTWRFSSSVFGSRIGLSKPLRPILWRKKLLKLFGESILLEWIFEKSKTVKIETYGWSKKIHSCLFWWTRINGSN